jgi:hypothetical protein
MTPMRTPKHILLPHISLIYAECRRVTDGTRTRALRSHNPPTLGSGRCPKLQYPLRYAVFFAGGCHSFPRVAL